MDKYLALARDWRRHLHRHPELSFQEFQTSAFVAREMGALPGAEIIRLTPTSLVVAFRTGRPGAKIGLRADLDALPIQEERPDLSFQSETAGVMHACGHDGHTAMLMAVCVYLSDHRDALSGEIYAIFQHAEEVPPGGASELLATGFFNDFDFIYGQHLLSSLPTGVIDIKEGACSANADVYRLNIIGRGGHAALPEQTIDPVLLGAQFVTLLQTLVARRVAPQEAMVISNTVFQAGTLQNIIPGTAFLMGSVRTGSSRGRDFARREIEALIAGLCLTQGARYEFDYQSGYDLTWNHPRKTQLVRALAEKRFGSAVESLPPLLIGEDFSAFAQRIPATFVFIGAGNEENHAPHHHPKFGLDEASLALGWQLMVDVARHGEIFRD